MELPWKRALIVGASSGMGEELARQLGKAGCRVALVARREAELHRVCDELNAFGGQGHALAYPHDVRETECVPALFQRIAHDLGGLDLVVYAAGVMHTSDPDAYDFSQDQLQVQVNLLGAMAWLNEAAQRFGRAGAGTIVGISSAAGERGRKGFPAYSATKAALNTYLEGLRNRVGAKGVTVLTVKPGPVDTPMTKDLDKKPLLIPAERAAREILDAARKRKNSVFVPGVWRPILFIIRSIPSPVFRKLNI